MIYCRWLCWETNNFVIYLLDIPDLIEYGPILFEIFPQDNLSLQTLMTVASLYYRLLITGDSFYDLLHCGWLFYPNADNPIIGSLS